MGVYYANLPNYMFQICAVNSTYVYMYMQIILISPNRTENNFKKQKKAF